MSQDPITASRVEDPGSQQAAPEYRIIDLGQFAMMFWRHRFLIVACTILGAVLGYESTNLMHPLYDATVRLMPPSHGETSILSLSPARNEGDLYLGLVGSRTVADDVIAHLNLDGYFHSHNPTEARRALSGITKISVDKDQFISVVVRSPQPEMAVKIANAYPQALSRLNRALAMGQAQARWEYYQGPLEDEKNKLAAAEDDLEQAQQKTGMVAPEAQVQLGLSAISNLEQQITARQEQLAALETGSTEQNPQVIQLKSQIASLSGQLAVLQAQNGGEGRAGPKAKTPELTLEIERKSREVRYHQTLFEVLSRQYENARVDESYSAPVELVDSAVFPDEKSWPSRKLFALAGLISGALAGLVWAWLIR